MKRVLSHPPREAKPTLWRSLDELADTPDFAAALEREFPQGAAEWHGGELSRRNFLQLMGGSMALAGIGLAGCRRPEAYLVPFTKSAEWTIPGKFLYYATSMPRRNGAMPLIATTSDGRPVKLEGNPLHPISNGATDTFAQASILDLYDPNRSKQIKTGGTKTDAAAFGVKLDEISADAAANGGASLAFLVEHNASPSRDRLLAQLRQKYPNLLWAEYEPLGAHETAAAVAASFGPHTVIAPDFSRADKVLAVDSDFLNASFSGLEQVRGFMARRRISEPGQPMNRLYVAETSYSSTGGVADHRLRLKPSEVGAFLRALGQQVAALTGDGNLATVVGALPESPLSADPSWIAAGRYASLGAEALWSSATSNPPLCKLSAWPSTTRSVRRDRPCAVCVASPRRPPPSRNWPPPCRPGGCRIFSSSAAIRSTTRRPISASVNFFPACRSACVSDFTKTKRPPLAHGMCRRRIISKVGATHAVPTARSARCNR